MAPSQPLRPVTIFAFAALALGAPPTGKTSVAIPSGDQYSVIDDYSTSWTLNGGWGTFGRSPDNYCDSCLVQPDHASAHAGTWSEASAPGASATLSFDGVGVQLFLVCPGHIPLPDGNVAIFAGSFSFSLDGADAGSLSIDGGCDEYVYNALVFEKNGLEKGTHNVTITNGGSGASDLLLDFAVVDDGSGVPSGPPPKPPGTPVPSGPIPQSATTVVIDDMDLTAWTYDNQWGSFDSGSICNECLVKPDPAKLQAGSWHESGGTGTATLHFTGVAISVFGFCTGPVLTKDNNWAVFSPNFTFTLDGAAAGSLSIAGGCDADVYNQRLFFAEGLEQKAHTFTITNGGGASDLLLDFAVVDVGETTTTTPATTPTETTPAPSGPTPGNPPASPQPPTGKDYVVLDDTSAQATYDGGWGVISKEHPCATCDTQFDFGKLNGGSYHELTGTGSATLKFSGTEVWVYGACPGTLPSGGQFIQSFTFNIDGKDAGSFSPLAGGCSTTVYSQLFFKATDLSSSSEHTLVITNVQGGGLTSDLVLDFFVLKSAAPPTGPPPPSQPPASPKPPTDKSYIRLDDTSAQAVYSGSWGVVSRDAPCDTCDTKFDFGKLSGATYHELTGAGSASVTFVGTEVWVYGACPGTLAGGGQFVQNFNIAIDGKQAGSFHGPAGGCSEYVYSQLLYKATGLAAGKTHTLNVTNIQGGQLTSDLVVDFFVVKSSGATQPGGPEQPPPPPPPGNPPSLPPASPPPPTGGTFARIDDASPLVTYSPLNMWGAVSQKAPCKQCATSFDFGQLSGGTYHEMSSQGSATISFSGTAIWVYGVCAGTLKDKGQFGQRFAITLDGAPAGNFNGPPGGCSKNVYNELFYKVDGLSKGDHTLSIANLQSSAQGALISDLVLDFFVVDTAGLDQPTPPPTNPGTPDGGLPKPSNPPASPPPPTGANFKRIDDADALVTYEPLTSWGAITQKSPCKACATQFDFGKLSGASYHESTSAGTATLKFAGTEIYVYGACAGTLPGNGQYLQSFTLTIDGTANADFHGPPGGCAKNSYSQLLFKVTGLSKGTHTAVVSNVQDLALTSDLVIDFFVVNTAGLSQPAPPVGVTPPATGPAPPAPQPWPASPAPPTGGTFVLIDDQEPQFAYDGSWGSVTKAHQCEDCATKFSLDTVQAATYHELSSAGGSATLAFAGVSLYVYGVCPGTLEGGGQFLQMFSLEVDEAFVANFTGPAGGCTENAYNQLLFKVDGLQASTHAAKITNQLSSFPNNPSDLVIDFAVVDGAGLTQPADASAANPAKDPLSALPVGGKFIDDTDEQWAFSGPFGAISIAHQCKDCLIQPDPSKAYGGTWRDLSKAGSATLTFQSSAVSVFVICPGPIDGGSFFRGTFDVNVDGVAQPQWKAPEKGCSQTLYNVAIANVTGLDPATTHTLTVTNIVADGQTPSDLMLDYAVLDAVAGSPTPETTPPPSKQPPPSGAADPTAASYTLLSIAATALLSLLLL